MPFRPEDFAAYWEANFPEDAARRAETEARLCKNCKNFAYRASDVKTNLVDIEASSTQGQCPDCTILWNGIKKLSRRLSLDDQCYALWNTSGSPPEKRDMLHVSICDGKIEDESLRLEFHTTHGSVENQDRIGGMANAVAQRAESKAGLERIREWALECSSSHENCKGVPSRLPKRVIDVGNGDRSHSLRLYQTKQEPERYVTLSHCWGSDVHTLPLRTLQTNIDDRIENIPWSSLSKVFQDAVEMTRLLGIRYIWIDSLCIIQDSKEDWEEQCSLMGKIYEGSYITIVATHASCGADGLLTNRVTSEEVGSNVFVRERLPHGAWFTTAKSRLDPNSGLPTLRRGWCYQEETLSTRLIHFTQHELVWVCKSSAHCECGFQEKFNWRPNPDTFPTHNNFNENIEWTDIAKVYSGTQLSREDDKLPALSAIAAKVQSKTGGTYLAGIWREDAILQMGWSTCGGAKHSAQYIAPSFSWASIIGKVSFEFLHMLHDAEEEFPLHASVRHALCQVDGLNAFGKVRHGSITLRGNLVPVQVLTSTSEDSASLVVKFKLWSRLPSSMPRLTGLRSRSNNGKHHIESTAPAKLDTEAELQVAITHQVYCLPLYSIGETYRDYDRKPKLARKQTCFNCLAAVLLIEYPSRPGVYRRIGVLASWSQVLLEKDYCLTEVVIE